MKLRIFSFINLLGFVFGSNKVLFIVLDGLTQDLINRVSTNTLDKLIQNGANFTLKPEFPADTLPTLQSMVTGQHVDMTGILSSEVDQYGTKLTQMDPEFWLYDLNLTTIAELNNLAGKVERSTGCIRFPGCQFYHDQNKIFTRDHLYEPYKDLSNKGTESDVTKLMLLRSKRSNEKDDLINEDEKTGEIHETSSKPSNDKVDAVEESTEQIVEVHHNTVDQFFFNKTSDQEWLSWLEQIDTVASWMKSEHPVNLVLFYLDQPAGQIKAFGPDSPEADLAVYKVDQFLEKLVEVFEERELLETVNLVVTGVHGYTEVTAEGVVDISNYVSEKDYFAYGTSTILNIQPVRLDQELDIFASLQKHDSSLFTLYNKHGIPESFNYKSNDRVTDIMLLAQEGHTFAGRFYQEVKLLNQKSHRQNLLDNKYGFAGYDNSLTSMESVLILAGPDIRPGGLTDPDGDHQQVQAVDVFPLLAHLLDLDIPSRNGSLQAFHNHLSNPPAQTAVQVIKHLTDLVKKQEYVSPETLLGLFVAVVLLFVVCCCWCCCCRNKSSDFTKIHNYKYSQVKNNRRREEVRVDGSEEDPGDKVGLLTSAIMEADDDDMFEQAV